MKEPITGITVKKCHRGYIGLGLYPALIHRRVSRPALHLHRPDPAAGAARLAQVLGQRKSNPQHQVGARRIPVAQLGEVWSRSVGRKRGRAPSSLLPPSFARPLRELDFRWKGNRARREEGAPRLYSQSIEGEFAGGRARSSASLRYTVLFDHPSLSRLIESVVLAGKGPLSPPDLLCPSKDPIYPATVWVFFFFKRILHI